MQDTAAQARAAVSNRQHRPEGLYELVRLSAVCSDPAYGLGCSLVSVSLDPCPKGSALGFGARSSEEMP